MRLREGRKKKKEEMVEDEEKDSVEERTARTKTWTGSGWRREKREIWRFGSKVVEVD